MSQLPLSLSKGLIPVTPRGCVAFDPETASIFDDSAFTAHGPLALSPFVWGEIITVSNLTLYEEVELSARIDRGCCHYGLFPAG